MDLRPYNLTSEQLAEAARVLNYQPFVLSDDMQTGVAYSWLHAADPRVKPKLLFRRGDPEWDAATAANESLRLLYDGFLQQIADHLPGGSLLDIGCNNGYFPVRAEMFGMRGCVGSDFYASYRRSVTFLNRVVGTAARFVHAPYQPGKKRIQTWRRFDVVAASAILCHQPNPLEFLAAIARKAKHAIFVWGAFAPTEQMAIVYEPPHPSLAHGRQAFPYNFNDNTRLSRPLFDVSMRELGFQEIIRLSEARGALSLPDHYGILAIRS
jgi:SAM-dependent methyltransferase